MRGIFLIFFVWFSSVGVNANTIKMEMELIDTSATYLLNESTIKPKKKGVAIALAATLGVFGVHRLYLGTAPKTPVIYTITLGGGFGALMVADIVAIIASEDVNNFSPNDKVFMWAK
jgi:TM2 domain-containing membrane protein YozV